MELQIYEKNGECVPLQFPHVHEKYLKTNDIGIMDTNDMLIKICHCFVADSLSLSLLILVVIFCTQNYISFSLVDELTS